MRLTRIEPGYYRTDDGRRYVVATERCGADGRGLPLKSRRWWNTGRIVDGQNEADDECYPTKRDAVAALRRMLTK